MTGLWQVNLRNLIATIGEEKTKVILSEFSCPLNEDVENFLKEKAIEFAKQDLATTHLVYSSYQNKAVLVGYYALAVKPVVIKSTALSAKWRSKLRRFAVQYPELKSYAVAMPLIGQLGKNYKDGYNELISGDTLLELACEKVRNIQYNLSGKTAYLECEDKSKLVDFYTRNGFVEFGRRTLGGDETSYDGKKYMLQMIKYFKDA